LRSIPSVRLDQVDEITALIEAAVLKLENNSDLADDQKLLGGPTPIGTSQLLDVASAALQAMGDIEGDDERRKPRETTEDKEGIKKVSRPLGVIAQRSGITRDFSSPSGRVRNLAEKKKEKSSLALVSTPGSSVPAASTPAASIPTSTPTSISSSSNLGLGGAHSRGSLNRNKGEASLHQQAIQAAAQLGLHSHPAPGPSPLPLAPSYTQDFSSPKTSVRSLGGSPAPAQSQPGHPILAKPSSRAVSSSRRQSMDESEELPKRSSLGLSQTRRESNLDEDEEFVDRLQPKPRSGLAVSQTRRDILAHEEDEETEESSSEHSNPTSPTEASPGVVPAIPRDTLESKAKGPLNLPDEEHLIDSPRMRSHSAIQRGKDGRLWESEPSLPVVASPSALRTSRRLIEMASPHLDGRTLPLAADNDLLVGSEGVDGSKPAFLRRLDRLDNGHAKLAAARRRLTGLLEHATSLVPRLKPTTTERVADDIADDLWTALKRIDPIEARQAEKAMGRVMDKEGEHDESSQSEDDADE